MDIGRWIVKKSQKRKNCIHVMKKSTTCAVQTDLNNETWWSAQKIAANGKFPIIPTAMPADNVPDSSWHTRLYYRYKDRTVRSQQWEKSQLRQQTNKSVKAVTVGKGDDSRKETLPSPVEKYRYNRVLCQHIWSLKPVPEYTSDFDLTWCLDLST